MTDHTYRPPTEDELDSLQAAFNEYYSVSAETFSIQEFPVVIVEDYAKGDDSYTGRLGIIVEGGANPTTYGFDADDEAFLLSDSLQEAE